VSEARTRSGIVALCGRTNVGKSTLVNRIVGGRVSIVSDRSQVTRRAIRGVRTYQDEGIQLVLVDVPGLHKPKDLLSEEMLARSHGALRDADAILCLVEAGDDAGGATRYVIDSLPPPSAAAERPVVLAVTKSDKHLPAEVSFTLREVGEAYPFRAKLAVSSESGHGIAELESELKALLPEGEYVFPSLQVTDLTREERAAEIVREKLLMTLRDELPHASHVAIDEISDRPDGLVFVGCTIFVERPSQKGIVIGKGGAQIKKIGELAREELEFLSKKRVFLKTEVKVKPNWRKDSIALKQFGLA
jgi:GTPase